MENVFDYCREQEKKAGCYNIYWSDFRATMDTIEYMYDKLPDDEFITYMQHGLIIYSQDVVDAKADSIKFWKASGRLDATITFCNHYNIGVENMNDDLKLIVKKVADDADEETTLRMMKGYALMHWSESMCCVLEDVFANETTSFYSKCAWFFQAERKRNVD